MKQAQSGRYTGSKIWRKARKLHSQHKELSGLSGALASGDERKRAAVSIDGETERRIRNIRLISEQLLELLDAVEAISSHRGRRDQVVWMLNDLRDHAAALENHRDMICWLESTKLCAIPKNLSDHLYADLWGKGIPIIITFGTLSAGGSFYRIKYTLGLDKLPPGRATDPKVLAV